MPIVLFIDQSPREFMASKLTSVNIYSINCLFRYWVRHEPYKEFLCHQIDAPIKAVQLTIEVEEWCDEGSDLSVWNILSRVRIIDRILSAFLNSQLSAWKL